MWNIARGHGGRNARASRAAPRRVRAGARAHLGRARAVAEGGGEHAARAARRMRARPSGRKASVEKLWREGARQVRQDACSSVGYNLQLPMLKIGETAAFARWFDKLKDRQARFRIAVRLRRLRDGNLGDVKPVGEGVSELRIDYGPGYRVYIAQRGAELIILLCGGDKRTQAADIARAKKLANEAKEWTEWQ